MSIKDLTFHKNSVHLQSWSVAPRRANFYRMCCARPAAAVVKWCCLAAKRELVKRVSWRILDPAFAKLLSVVPELPAEWRGPHASPRDPALEKWRVLRGLTDWLKQLAAQQPLLIVWEDAHWCDENSAEFLLFLARQLTGLSLSIWITCRPAELPAPVQMLLATLLRERRATEITLGRLSEAETEEMIRAIFGQKEPLRADLRESSYALCEGNPFVVEETVKALVSAGDIFYTRGGWSRKPLAQLHIPRSLHDAVHARVARLSAGARELVAVAAVAGRRFAFLHALTQQTIYQGLLARERRALHRQVGEALERLKGSNPEAPLENLAQQFFAGEVWDKAAVYAAHADARRRRMVLGVLGVQPESLADSDWRLNAAALSARPLFAKMNRRQHVARSRNELLKKIDSFFSERTPATIPLRQTASHTGIGLLRRESGNNFP